LKNLPKATEKESELIPPGNCVHLYRDGTSWQGSLHQLLLLSRVGSGSALGR
jgi:hypothetical protein